MNWREKLDPIVKTHLEKQILESVKHNNAYSNAKNPANAQLWVALANISKEIFEINLKLSYLEKMLQEKESILTKEKILKRKNIAKQKNVVAKT